MSFDINPPSRNLSNIQASAKAQDGGAGNTGYFRRDTQEEQASVLKEEIGDTFNRGDIFLEEEAEETLGEFLKRLILDFIEKILSLFRKKNKNIEQEDTFEESEKESDTQENS